MQSSRDWDCRLWNNIKLTKVPPVHYSCAHFLTVKNHITPTYFQDNIFPKEKTFMITNNIISKPFLYVNYEKYRFLYFSSTTIKNDA